MADSLQRRIRQGLDEDPSRPAVAFVDARGRHAWWTRQELHERAARVASRLVESGLEPGEVAVVVSVDPTECATTLLGIWMSGAVPLLAAPPSIQGMNSSLARILDEVVRRSRARIVVLARSMAASADALIAAHPATRIELGFERLLASSESWDARHVDPARADRGDGIAALQQSSGTTRFPRIAVWEQSRVLSAVEGMASGMQLAADDVFLNWTPLYHDMGLVNNLLTCLVHGLPLALLSPLDVVRRPALWMRALEETGATQTWSPNFGYALAAQRCSDTELDALDLTRVRGFWNAAERVHLETFRQFHARFEPFGARWSACKANFGCVESIGGATFSRGELQVERVDFDRLRGDGVAQPADASTSHAQTIVSCGRAYPGLELRIFDDEGRALPDGHVGAIGLNGPGRFERYLDDPEETARVRRGEFVLPGDEGYLRDGELYWTGRASERINLQGTKHDPSELEHVLLDIAGLRKGCFAAFGVEDALRGTEVLVLLCEIDEQAATRARELSVEIRRKVATELGLTIEDLLLLPKGALTKTSSGKRRHRHFREQYLRGEMNPLHRSRAGQID